MCHNSSTLKNDYINLLGYYKRDSKCEFLLESELAASLIKIEENEESILLCVCKYILAIWRELIEDN